VVLIGLVAGSAALRIQLAFDAPSFDAERVEGMVKSDPGLLFYITQRIADAGGVPPADFRADPRIEHPEDSDIPAMFTVGEEFLVAWTWLATGRALPLHATAVIVLALLASAVAFGVFGLTRELAGTAHALWAAALWTATIASYRTIGFVFIREDLSLPLFALHLWLLARAARVTGPLAYALAGAALGAALATWHAMTFIAALELVMLLAWFARSGQHPLRRPGALALPLVLAAIAVAVPVLRAKGFLGSPTFVGLFALAAAGTWARRAAATRGAELAATFGTLAALALAAGLASAGLDVGADYAHVREFAWSKLRHLGQLPDDPRVLSFGARLLWQGPFATGSGGLLLEQFAIAGVMLPVALLCVARDWLRGGAGGDEADTDAGAQGGAALFVGLALASAAAAWFVARMVVVGAILLPVAAAIALRRSNLRAGGAIAITLLVFQIALFAIFAAGRAHTWHLPAQTAEIRALLDFVRTHVPPNEPIVGDFVNSTAILAHTDHPTVLQPKYETRRSRERIEQFVTHVFRGTPAELAQWLRDLDSRYLLIDAVTLWPWRYKAGIPIAANSPVRGSAAVWLLNPDPEIQAQVPGFELVYASTLPDRALRLYRLLPD